jgi:hypothetical protein
MLKILTDIEEKEINKINSISGPKNFNKPVKLNKNKKYVNSVSNNISIEDKIDVNPEVIYNSGIKF